MLLRTLNSVRPYTARRPFTMSTSAMHTYLAICPDFEQSNRCDALEWCGDGQAESTDGNL